jgi:hypothetical protein
MIFSSLGTMLLAARRCRCAAITASGHYPDNPMGIDVLMIENVRVFQVNRVTWAHEGQGSCRKNSSPNQANLGYGPVAFYFGISEASQ